MIGNRYELIRKLGEGGMGEVYLAHDSKNMSRVAIKFAFLGNRDPESEKERFFREIEFLKSIEHPNIVKLLDSGQDGESYFYVMEFIQGHEIRERENFRRLAILLANVASALSALHQKGIVHGDIKPSNIMLVGNRPVLLDFGVAKKHWQEKIEKNDVSGTVAYMSPESVTGQKTDGRSDLYSLGIVLYEQLTGCLPFGEGQIQNQIFRILHEKPARPSLVNPKIPEELEKICIKLISKDPDSRYQSAGELEDVLLLFLKGSTEEPSQLVANVARAPVIGRDGELSKFKSLLDIMELGEGGIVLVQGQSGIGKTSLVEEFRRIALSRNIGFVLCDGRQAWPGMPAIGRVLDELVNFDIMVDKPLLSRFSGQIMELSPLFFKKYASPDFKKAEMMTGKQEPEEALAKILLYAFDEGVVFAFDGIDDPQTIGVCRKMAGMAGKAKKLVILSGFDPKTLSLKSSIVPVVFELKPFGVEDVKAFLNHLGITLSEELVCEVMRLSGGIPGKMFRIIKHLVPVYEKKNRDYRNESAIFAGRKFMAISDNSREVLGVVCLMEKPRTVELVRSIAGLSEDQMKNAIQELVSMGLAHEISCETGPVFGPALPEMVKFVKEHAPTRELAELHKKIADCFCSFPDIAGDEDFSGEAGMHYMEAGEYLLAARCLVPVIQKKQSKLEFMPCNEIIGKLFPHLDKMTDKKIVTSFSFCCIVQFINTGIGRFLKGTFEILEGALTDKETPESVKIKYATWLGLAKARLGELNSALSHLDLAWKMFSIEPDDDRGFYLTRAFSEVYINSSRFKKARRYCLLNLGYARKCKNDTRLSQSLNNLGIVQMMTGENDKAEKTFNENIALARKIGSQPQELTSMLNLAGVYSNRKEFDRTISVLLDLKKKAKDIGDINKLSIIYRNLIDTYEKTYKKEEALSVLEEALGQLNRFSSTARLHIFYDRAVRMALEMENFDLAENFIEGLQSSAFESGSKFQEAFAFALQGDMMFIKGNNREAISSLKVAWEIFDRVKKEHVETYCMIAHKYAFCVAFGGNPAGAMEILKTAHPMISQVADVEARGFSLALQAWIDMIGAFSVAGKQKSAGKNHSSFSKKYWNSSYRKYRKVMDPISGIDEYMLPRPYAAMGFAQLVLERSNIDKHYREVFHDDCRRAVAYLDEAIGQCRKSKIRLYVNVLAGLRARASGAASQNA